MKERKIFERSKNPWLIEKSRQETRWRAILRNSINASRLRIRSIFYQQNRLVTDYRQETTENRLECKKNVP